MNKRGQVFLIAAVVIAGIIFGISAIETEVKLGSSNEAFYDLSEEVGFETKRVLDYGVYHVSGNPFLKIEDFFEKYIDYLGREQVVLIVGDELAMKVYFFEEDDGGSVGLSWGGSPINDTIPVPFMGVEDASVVSSYGETLITVLISEINYEFKLRDGENFFFVIIKHEDDEKFVAIG